MNRTRRLISVSEASSLAVFSDRLPRARGFRATLRRPSFTFFLPPGVGNIGQAATAKWLFFSWHRAAFKSQGRHLLGLGGRGGGVGGRERKSKGFWKQLLPGSRDSLREPSMLGRGPGDSPHSQPPGTDTFHRES